MFPNHAQSAVADAVVSVSEPVTLAGGADFAATDLNISLKVAPVLVAADGGANALLEMGRRPAAVIGDMDSISDAARDAFSDRLHHDPDQNTTDFQKALARINAPAIVAVGFTGARMDHTLSVLGVMSQTRQKPVVLFSADDVAFLAPQTLGLTLPQHTRVSLMPLAPSRVSTVGLQWDLNEQDMAPTGFASPSNAVAAEVVRIRAEGAVLVVLPRVHLHDAIDAVRGQ